MVRVHCLRKYTYRTLVCFKYLKIICSNGFNRDMFVVVRFLERLFKLRQRASSIIGYWIIEMYMSESKWNYILGTVHTMLCMFVVLCILYFRQHCASNFVEWLSTVSLNLSIINGLTGRHNHPAPLGWTGPLKTIIKQKIRAQP